MWPHAAFVVGAVPPAPHQPGLSELRSRRVYEESCIPNYKADPTDELKSRRAYGDSGVLPLNRLIDRVDRLESCVESELRSALQLCRGAVEARPDEQRLGANNMEEVLRRIRRLEGSTHELNQQIVQCAPVEELRRCLTEADGLALRQHLDNQFGAQMERAFEYRVDTEKVTKAWRDDVDRRFSALEKRISNLRPQDVPGAADVLRGFSLESAERFEALEAKYHSLEKLQAASDSSLADVSAELVALQQQGASVSQHFSTSTREVREDIKHLKQIAGDQRVQSTQLERRVNSHAKEASELHAHSAATELRSDMLARTDELKRNVEEQLASLKSTLEHRLSPATFGLWQERLGEVEKHKEGFAEAFQSHWDRFAMQLRMERGPATDSDGLKVQLAMDDLHRSTDSRRKEMDFEIKNLRDCTSTLTKQLEHQMDETNIHVERSRSVLKRLEEMSLVSQRSENRLADLETRLGTLKDVSQQQLETLAGDVRAETQGKVEASESKVLLEISLVSQRADSRLTDFETRLGTLKEGSQHQLELIGRDVRAEVQGNLEVSEGKVLLITKELQNEASRCRRELDQFARESQELRATMSKQALAALEEARSASDRAGAATQAGQEATAAADCAERRLQNFEERVDVALEGYQQHMTQNTAGLRTEATNRADMTKRHFEHAAEELRTSSASLSKQIERSTSELRSEIGTMIETVRKQVEHTSDETRVAGSTLAKQLEGAIADLAASDERSRDATRLAEGASAKAQKAETRAASAERRVDDSVDSRCQRAERVARESAQDVRNHTDAVAKQLSHSVEDLKATVGSLSKQSQNAVDDARGADERGVVVAKLAQEASAAVQRLESAATRKPDVDFTKVFREQLGHTATELRLEAKKAVDMLGKEMESTVLELRGTVSSMALQIECGVSGNTSALADAVESAAQRHVDHLEWLKTLDTHRGQMEKHQAELEDRLSAVLDAQKVSLEADLEAVNFKMTQQLSRISDLDSGYTSAHSGFEFLKANVSSLETQMKAHSLEWEGFSESMRDRVGSLQANIAENKWGMATIAGAISSIAKPGPTSPSRMSHDGDSRYLALDSWHK